MIRGRVVAAGLTVLIACGALVAATFRKDATRDARAIHREALDATVRGDPDSALVLLAEAWAADPAWVIPLVEINRLGDPVGLPRRVLRRIDSVALATDGTLLLSCAHQLAVLHYDSAVARRASSGRHVATRRCGEYGLDLMRSAMETHRLWPKYRESVMIARDHHDHVASSDAARAHRSLTGDGFEHPMFEIYRMISGSLALRRAGEHDEADAFDAAAERRAREIGPGAAYLALARHRDYLGSVSVGFDSTAVRRAREAHRRAAHSTDELIPRQSARLRLNAVLSLGVNLQHVGQLTESNRVLRQGLRLADSMHTDVGIAYARSRIGRNLVKLGRLGEAEGELLAARALGATAEVRDVVSESSHDLLHLYEARGDYASAVKAGNDFARYAAFSGTQTTVSMAQHDLGWLHRRNGNIAAAEAAFQRMLPAVHPVFGDFWAGEYLEYAGRLEEARVRYERSARNNQQDRGRALAGLVRIHEAIGNVSEAARVAETSDRDSLAWFPEYAPLVPGVLARNGDRRAARAQFRNARATMLRRGQTQSFAQIALESAENEHALGDATSARILADSAADAAALVGAREIEARARALSAAAALGQSSAVSRGPMLAALETAVRRGDAMRIPQLSAALHLQLGDALAVLGRQRDAMTHYVRAAAWVDSTAGRILADPSRAGYRARHIGVTNRALALLLRAHRHPNRDHEFARWSRRRKGGAPAVHLDPASLSPRQALIDYVMLDSVIGAMVVTRTGTALRELSVPPDSVREWIARFRQPIAPRIGSVVDRRHIGFDDVLAERLYRALLDPLLPLLSGRTELVILPDDALHMLPFDALVSSGQPRRFVIDDYTISYATFVGATRARRDAGVSWRALAVGGSGASQAAQNAATGETDEISAIERALPGRLTVLDGADATAAAVRRHAEAEGLGVLHFATHAEANDASPDHARLALANSASHEGWLHAFEIREWRLDGALVVLSACETAAGRIAGGEGTLSLSRAFLQAGATGTVATLWPVGAPTAQLMERFYADIARGVAPATALRAARLELRAAHDHPFYWAPFVLTTSLSHFDRRADNQ